MAATGLASFSAFPRIDNQIATKTTSGALVTVLGVVVAAVLFTSEMEHFINPGLNEEMRVDESMDKELRVALNLTLPGLPCAALTVATGDLSGSHEADSRFARHMDIHKVRLNKDGKVIVAKGKTVEYQAPISIQDFAFGHSASLNLQGTAKHIKDIDEELEQHEGCNVVGYIDSKRIAGRFQLTIHHEGLLLMTESQQDLFHKINDAGHPTANDTKEVKVHLDQVDVTHTIHSLAFGPQFPGQVNPLDGEHREVGTHVGAFKYFLKIVPTEYIKRSGVILKTNQFSVSEYFVPNTPDRQLVPTIQFVYDISPIVVSISEKQHFLAHFIVRLCAVIGGVFATTGLLDRMIKFSVQEPPGSPIAQ